MAKTIVEKLNLQKYKKVAVLNLPDGANYLAELTDFDTELHENTYDLIFAFVLHMESLKELVNKVIQKDLLNKNGCGHIKIFGGGGGTILPAEIDELHAYGITRIYSPDDGRHMGLQGMIEDVIKKCSPLQASPLGGGF